MQLQTLTTKQMLAVGALVALFTMTIVVALASFLVVSL